MLYNTKKRKTYRLKFYFMYYILAGTLGILTAQCIGAVCNWQWISIICGGFNIPLLIALLFIPESPVYLISKDQIGKRIQNYTNGEKESLYY